MRILPKVLAAAIAATLISAPAIAEELTGTLKKIKDSGTIVLGHRDASIPFSYLGTEPGKPVGYSHDIQLKVVEAIKKELALPDLKVRYNLVTSQTRIPLVQNGTVDIECGSTTNNLERQKQVGFSVGIFEVGTRLLSKKTAGINDFADLKGKNVVTTAGTTSERLLKSMNADKQMGMNIISAKDHGESFLMLESGRAVAFMMDDALLYGEMAKAKKPDDCRDRRAAVLRDLRLHGSQGRRSLQESGRQGHRRYLRLGRDQRHLRQVVHPAHPAEEPEPQLPHER